MASPNVAPVLAKEFVSLKIEADRMVGGKEILKRYQANERGIPWFVFLDGDGTAMVTSDGPKGNVGFPAAPARDRPLPDDARASEAETERRGHRGARRVAGSREQEVGTGRRSSARTMSGVHEESGLARRRSCA